MQNKIKSKSFREEINATMDTSFESPRDSHRSSLADSIGLFTPPKRREGEEKGDSVLRASSSAKIVDTRLAASKCFVPKLLLGSIKYSLEADSHFTMKPSSMFFDGVCVIVDISGFTRLSGQYCSKGKAGIDELQKATNGFIGQLVEIVYHYGGDIIKFAGDAILCVFSDQQPEEVSISSKAQVSPMQEMSDMPMSALLCALEVSQVQTPTLTVHVGISTGEICFSCLGGYNQRWECLIAGECLVEISQCLDEAKSKQVVVTPQFVELLRSHHLLEVDCITLDSANVRLDRRLGSTKKSSRQQRRRSVEDITKKLSDKCDTAEVLDVVGGFIPLPIYNSVYNHLAVVAELREVTTMFMMWDSYNFKTHRDIKDLQPLFYKAQEILSHQGAFIRQFLVDDKGCVLIACWGVPSATYTDNAVRAMVAATSIRSAFIDSKFKSSYGITTGNVYCGTVGSDLRSEYAAIGDVVNLSARLMSKAKGSVLIDESTFCRLPSAIAGKLQKPPPVTVKGKEAPISIYAYVDIKPIVAKSSDISGDSLVVREQHVQALAQLLNKVAPLKLTIFQKQMSRTASKSTTASMMKGGNRRSFANLFSALEDPMVNLVYIEGKQGSGKGTLCRWFLKECESRPDVRIFKVRLEPADTIFDYRALLLLFQVIIGEENLASEEGQQAVLSRLLNEIHRSDTDPSRRNQTIAVMKLALGVTADLSKSADDIEPSISASNSQLSVNEHSSGRKALTRLSFNTKLLVRKMSREVINETLKSIFEYLLQDETTIILIEHVYNSDDESLKALLTLATIHAKAIFLFTSTFAEEVALSASNDGRRSTKQANMSTKALNKINAQAISIFRNVVISKPNTTHLQVNLFTVAEIEVALCSYLENAPPDPSKLAKVVYKLSGGSSFWLMEIIEFIRATGVKEFLQAMESNSTNTQEHPADVHTDILNALKPDLSSPDNLERHKHRSPDKVRIPANNSREGLTNDSSSPQTHHSGTSGSVKKSKLDAFVISRFENMLTHDAQMILKVASAIGSRLTSTVLCGVLSPRLQEVFEMNLDTLYKDHWLVRLPNVVGAAAGEEDNIQLAFSHDFMRSTIYELTPTSERKQLHTVIAAFIEEKYPGNANFYSMLSDQYRHFNDESAFEYCCKAALHMVRADIMNGPECMDLLLQASGYCETVHDAEVVLKILSLANNSIRRNMEVLKSRHDELLQGRTDGGSTASNKNRSTRMVEGRGICCLFECLPWRSSVVPTGAGGDFEHDDDEDDLSTSRDDNQYSSRSKSAINSQFMSIIQRGLGQLEYVLDQKRVALLKQRAAIQADMKKNTARASGSGTGGGSGAGSPTNVPSVDAADDDVQNEEREWQTELFNSSKFQRMSAKMSSSSPKKTGGGGGGKYANLSSNSDAVIMEEGEES